MSTSSYESRLANSPHDVAEVCDFMKRHFYPEETIFRSLLAKYQPNDHEWQTIDEDQSKIVELMVLNSPCIAIRHQPSNSIAAMSMMIGYSSGKDDFNVYAEYQAKSHLVSEYVNGVARMIDAAKMMPARRVLELDMVAVSSEHSRQGLAVRLLKESLDYARRMGFDVVDGLFTSEYARRAAEKVGMKSLMDYELDRWCGLDGVEDAKDRRASLMVVAMGRNEIVDGGCG